MKDWHIQVILILLHKTFIDLLKCSQQFIAKIKVTCLLYIKIFFISKFIL